MHPRLAAPLALAAALAAPASAQVYASERALVAQTVSGTTITLEYYRPRARGRELYGKLVPWGRPWTPGANWATTLEVDHDVTLEGRPLPKGKYSIWTVPRADEWTVIVHRTPRVFHTRPPSDSGEQLRFTVKPVQGPHVEVLTWAFPAVAKDSAELHLQWGTTHVPLRLGIGPAAAAAVALSAEERRRYVGVYRVTNLSPQARVKATRYTVFDSLGVLRLRRHDPPDNYYDAQFDLHRIGEHTFLPIMYRDGVLVGAEPAQTIRFTVEGGRATGVESIFATGVVSSRGVLETKP